MTDHDPTTQSEADAARPAWRVAVPRRLRRPHREEVKNTGLILAGALTGWFLEAGLTYLQNRIAPDPYREQAATIRDKLSTDSTAIREMTDAMAVDLAALRSGAIDAGTLEELIAKAEALVARSEAVRETVDTATEFSGEMAEVRAAAKAEEIARLGYSTQSDFTMAEDQTAVLCAERFSFGLPQTDRTRVWYVLSSGEDTRSANCRSGHVVSLDGDTMRVTVTYTGPVASDDGRRYGFNFACEPVPPAEP